MSVVARKMLKRVQVDPATLTLTLTLSLTPTLTLTLTLALTPTLTLTLTLTLTQVPLAPLGQARDRARLRRPVSCGRAGVVVCGWCAAG